MNEGWICPRCKKVNAPDVKQCDCEYNNTRKDYKTDYLKDIEELKRHLEEEQKQSEQQHLRYVPYYPYPYYPWYECYPDWTYRPYCPPYYTITWTTGDTVDPK